MEFIYLFANSIHEEVKCRLKAGYTCYYSVRTFLPSIVLSKFKWAGHIARMEEGRSIFKILTGKPTGNRPFRRTRCR